MTAVFPQCGTEMRESTSDLRRRVITGHGPRRRLSPSRFEDQPEGCLLTSNERNA
jgi:hypothetical protein